MNFTEYIDRWRPRYTADPLLNHLHIEDVFQFAQDKECSLLDHDKNSTLVGSAISRDRVEPSETSDRLAIMDLTSFTLLKLFCDSRSILLVLLTNRSASGPTHKLVKIQQVDHNTIRYKAPLS